MWRESLITPALWQCHGLEEEEGIALTAHQQEDAQLPRHRSGASKMQNSLIIILRFFFKQYSGISMTKLPRTCEVMLPFESLLALQIFCHYSLSALPFRRNDRQMSLKNCRCLKMPSRRIRGVVIFGKKLKGKKRRARILPTWWS
jgi:hypothetical protein